MANKDTILTIYDSDIISESMHKINYNFELLLNKDDVSDWKLSKLEQKINGELENIRRTSDERAGGLSRELEDLQELLEGLHSHEEIQAMVDSAIKNAESTLRGFISTMAGEQISEMVAGFAKTADISRLQGLIDGLNGRVDGLENSSGGTDDREYVSSEAFTQYKSDAARRQAEANMMAANSTFKKNDAGYYILWDPDNPDSDVPSVYKSLADFYNANINEIDPNRLGLSDPDVYKRFLAACERTFKSVFTELAQVRAYVEDGAAGFDILAAIDKDGHNIAAAIIGYVNEDGSNITISANHVEIDTDKFVVYGNDIIMDADHRLALLADGFTINSDNFIVDLDGNVQMTGDLFAKSFSTNNGNVIIGNDGILHAQGAEISGDLNALTLTAANGNTKILSDGTLVAKSANISGEITAQSFSAESSYKEINTSDGYSGNVRKNTTITGEQFSIIPEGILKNSDPINHPDIDLSKNSLYIEIIDELDNPDTSIIPDSKLYGVPVLCMVYKGKTYRMSPGAWLGNTAGDTSTMRFILRNNYITHLTLNALDSTNASKYYLSGYKTLSGTNIQYYFFRPEDKPHTNNRSNSYGYKFIDWGIGEDSLYQFDVLNWGGTAGNSPSNITWSDLKNTYGLISSYDSNAGTEVGSYVLGSTLGKEGLGYAGTGGDTVINSKKCGEMSAYLPDSQKSIANKESRIVLDKSWIQSNTEFEQYSVWGCKGIVEFMKSLLLSGGVDTQYAENPIWKTNYFSGSSEDTVFFDRSINGKLPFDENSNGTFDGDHMVEMSYAYYPVYYINKESGKYNTLSNGSDKVLTKITVKAQKAMLTKENSNRVTVIRSNPSYFPGAKNSETMHILHFGLEIEFYVVLDFRGQFIPMSSSVQDDTNVVGYKVKEFFTNFNFSSLKSEFSDDKPYSNFFKVTGTLYCEPEDTTSGCYITLIDNYS